MRALEAVAPLIKDPWCIAAGAVMGLVWNHGTGRPDKHGIKDIDVVYFDAFDLSEQRETALEQVIHAEFPVEWPPPDAKNQARVHLWYERIFGYAIQPHETIEAAMATWPTAAGAVGVSLRNGSLHITAPFGLEDLFARRVRPNKRHITQEIFDEKVQNWRRAWPEIQVIEWDEEGRKI